MNRQFLHPLGLRLNLTEEGDIEFYKTNRPQGYITEIVSDFSRKVFIDFRMKKLKEREQALGYIIQTKGMFRAQDRDDKNMKRDHPNRNKIRLIESSLQQFAFSIYARLLQKQEKDKPKVPKLKLAYESKVQLYNRIHHALSEEDYIGAGAYLILLINFDNEIEGD